MMTVQNLEKQILKLDVRSRARLARTLLSSLDELTDLENEKLWAEEASRRHSDLIKGKNKSRSAETVLKAARERLK